MYIVENSLTSFRLQKLHKKIKINYFLKTLETLIRNKTRDRRLNDEEQYLLFTQ